MAKIVDIKGREVLDSRGNPTVEADVIPDNGIVGSACAPPVLPPVPARPSSCAMATRAVTWARACWKAVANINGPIRDPLLAATRPTRKPSTTR